MGVGASPETFAGSATDPSITVTHAYPSGTSTVVPQVVATRQNSSQQTSALGLDREFDADGRVIHGLQDVGFSGASATAVVQVGTANYVVAGWVYNSAEQRYYFALAELDDHGQLSTFFGTDGWVRTDISVESTSDTPFALTLTPDLKLLVAGTAFTPAAAGAPASNNLALARYTLSGTLDTTFGPDGTGIVTTPLGGRGIGYDVAQRLDGKIYVAAQSAAPAGSGHTVDFAVARYTQFGSLDTTFGTNGIATVDFGTGRNSGARGIALQPNSQNVVVSGYVLTDAAGRSDWALARLDNAGNLDSTFGDGGKLTIDFQGGYDMADEVAIDSQGRVVVGGGASDEFGSNQMFAAARLTSNGQPDTSFGPDGNGRVATNVVDGGFGDYDGTMALDASGRVLLAGRSLDAQGDGYYFGVVRYTAAGAPDPTFGTGGRVLTGLSAASSVANAVMVGPEGRIVVAGQADVAGGSKFALARFLPDNELRVRPNAPGNVHVESLASGVGMRVSWDDLSNAEQGYRVLRADPYHGQTTVAELGANATSFDDTTSVLVGGTTYTYQVMALNGRESSALVGATPFTMPLVAPVSLTATAVSATQINLAWVDRNGSEGGYTVERSPIGGTYAQVAVLPAHATSFPDPGVTAGTAYRYRVTATRDGSIPASSTAAAAAGTVTVRAYAGVGIRAEWTAITGSTGYRVFRRAGAAGDWVQVGSTAGGVTWFGDQTAAAGTAYAYRVLAINSGFVFLADSPQVTATAGSPAADADGDALDTLGEFNAGTDPARSDTDADQLKDGWEVKYGLNPLSGDDNTNGTPDAQEDRDGDTLTNLRESQAGTDPFKVDTDGDTLPDGWEIGNGFDPLNGDQDHDNIPDGQQDPDGDGLDNLGESQAGTRPNDYDTDDDFLPDGWEQQNGLDPLNSDQDGNFYSDADDSFDGDGLTNISELDNGTDPGRSDTDGDGASDSEEVDQGSDPLDPADGGQAPAEDTKGQFKLRVGDPSDSHSERWQLRVGDKRVTNTSPTALTLAQYFYRAGGTYPVSLRHIDGAGDLDWQAEILRGDEGPWLPYFIVDDSAPKVLQNTGNGGIPGVEFSTAYLHLPQLDADVDSDDSGAIDGTDDEDRAELDPSKGAYVGVGDDFAPLSLSLSANVAAAGPDPDDTQQPLPRVQVTFSYDTTAVRIWKTGRTAEGEPPPPADLITSGTPVVASSLGLAPGGSTTLYVEALQDSGAPVPITISAQVTGSKWSGSLQDKVHVQPVKLDIDVDSDNTNGTGDPDQSESEESIEDDAGHPGKLIVANNNDDNENDLSDQSESGVLPEEDDLVPVVLSVSSSMVGKPLSLSLTSGEGLVRVWQSAQRDASGPLLGDGTSTVDLVVPSGGKTVWVEGMAGSTADGDVRLTLAAKPSATTAPSTNPSTQPATRPANSVRLTVADVERISGGFGQNTKSFRDNNIAWGPRSTAIAVLRGSGSMDLRTVFTNNQDPAPFVKSNVKWAVRRNAADSAALQAGQLPTITPDPNNVFSAKLATDAVGSFSVVLYDDLDGNGSFDEGKDLNLKVFRLIEVGMEVKNNNVTSDPVFRSSPIRSPDGRSATAITTGDPGTGKAAMHVSAVVELTGGGANERLGLGLIHLGWIGNAKSDSVVAKYQNGGSIESRLPPNVEFPLLDTSVDNAGTGGGTAFRKNSKDILGQVEPPNRQQRTILSLDAPGTEVFDFFQPQPTDPAANPVTNVTGGYKFTEALAAYSDAYPQTYAVAGKFDWSLDFDARFANNAWAFDGSKVTLPQGGTIDVMATPVNARDSGIVTVAPSWADRTMRGYYRFNLPQ